MTVSSDGDVLKVQMFPPNMGDSKFPMFGSFRKIRAHKNCLTVIISPNIHSPTRPHLNTTFSVHCTINMSN